MKLIMRVVMAFFGMILLANASSAEQGAALHVLLAEVKPGSMGTEHYCMLVFDDHRFHAEKGHRRLGKDRERMVYEGQLSDSDWNALTAIVDGKQFRELRVPPSPPALVVSDPHPYTISVARGDGYQNMEFLTKASLKPFEAEVKPLLRWWDASRNQHMAPSEAPVDSRCTLNDATGIFSN
jgi:hypothetical protein